MKSEINIVIADHSYSRVYNSLGGAIDIKAHNWIHINVKFMGSPDEYRMLLKAFSTDKPFELLGWSLSDHCSTKTISRWTVRESPVAKQEGDSLWLSFECLDEIPQKFFQYLSNEFQIKILISYCPPYRTGRWDMAMFEPI